MVSQEKRNHLETTEVSDASAHYMPDEGVRYFAEQNRALFTKPQYQYLVTVLLGLMECEGKRTLSGLLHEVSQSASLSGLSRFLSEAPWSKEALVGQWLTDFREELVPTVEAERQS